MKSSEKFRLGCRSVSRKKLTMIINLHPKSKKVMKLLEWGLHIPSVPAWALSVFSRFHPQPKDMHNKLNTFMPTI